VTALGNAATLEPDRAQIEIFTDAMFRHAGQDGYVSIRSFLADNKTFRISTAKLKGGLRHLIEVAEDDARRAANAPRPATFCPPIAVFSSADGWRARQEDLLKGLALSAEIDEHPDEALNRLEEILGPATLIVKSGGQWIDPDDTPRDKLHLHWRLNRPAMGNQLARLKQARRLAAEIVGADASNIPTVHCLRWPGSWHCKTAPRLCHIAMAAPDVEIDLDEAIEKLEAVAPKPAHGNGHDRSEANPAQWGELAASIIAGKSLHDNLARLAAKYARSGTPIGAGINQARALMDASAARHDRPEEWQTRFDDILRAFDTAYDKYAPPPPQQPPADEHEPQPPPPNDGAAAPAAKGVTLDDFFAYMPMHDYIFAPSREMWPGKSVNARIPPVRVGVDEDGQPTFIPASLWLDKNNPVEQMTWAPGEPQLIRNRLITGGGWIARPGVTVFNLYRPPTLAPGDPGKAGAWLDHVRLVYPADAGHIIRYLAHRVQRPQDKINHALVLGGPQGIGKDTLLEPAKRAVGPWNFAEVSPQQLLGRFNGFLKSVILRVSEARDLGDVNRYQFYDHLKSIIAAPPDVLRVDEKNLREYSVPNVCGVVITTNHLTDGIFLPADDRRHYVAWSKLTKDDFEADYWAKLWSWYDRGGDRHIGAYLATLDLAGWDPKAPPPKTPAFWAIVDASRAPEDAELADVIDELGAGLKDANGDPIPPVAFTLARVLDKAIALAPRDKDDKPERSSFAAWLADRKNRRQTPHRFEQCGYSPVRNDFAKDGLWKIQGARQVIYALASRSLHDRLAAAKLVVERAGETVLELSVGR
jgi:hypothetical protein